MFSAVAGKVVGKMMTSLRDRFSHSSATHETNLVCGQDFQELSQCVQIVSSYEACGSNSRLMTDVQIQEVIVQLTECLARIQGQHACTHTKRASHPSVPPSTMSKDEDQILSLASQLISNMYINKANHPRIFQKLKKALQVLLSIRPEMISQVKEKAQQLVVIPSSKTGMSVNDLSRVSSLFESSDVMRDIVRQNFSQILLTVSRTLAAAINIIKNQSDEGLIQLQRVPTADACYLAAKVFLQMCQHGREQLKPLIWDPKHSTTLMNKELGIIISGLVNLIENKRFSKDSALMAGSCLAMVLNSTIYPQQAAQTIVRLLTRYSGQYSDRSSNDIQIGNIMMSVEPFIPEASSSLVFARLAVIRGVLTCCNKTILLADASLDQKHQMPCINALFPMVCHLCKTADGEFKYHSSEGLSLYLQAVKSLQSALQKDPGSWLFTQDSTHTSAILQLIWQEWQSPVDGVVEMIRSALSTLLDLHDREIRGHGNSNSKLVDSITSSLVNTAWHIKGRYQLLTCLVPHCSAINLLVTYHNLPGELLRCLGTNCLAAAATELHNVLTRRMREEIVGKAIGGLRGGQGDEEYAERWGSIWKEVMMEGLCSTDSLVRYHTSKYWLPCALKNFPGILHLIMRDLGPPSGSLTGDMQVQNLHACIVLLKYARANNSLDSDWLDNYGETISAGLWHTEGEIQADALGLLCCSPKKSELPSNWEMLLLRKTLPYFLNSESAAFRNQLRHNLSVFLSRLYDGSLVLVKRLRKQTEQREEMEKKKTDKDVEERMQQCTTTDSPIPLANSTSPVSVEDRQLDAAVDFLDWLVEVCFGSLFVGACYQRKRAALDILGVLYECLLAHDKKQKKTDNSVGVMVWAMEHGKCNLLSERNASLLLECIQDGSNDLRSSSYHLLSTYFPAALPTSEEYPHTSSSQILCQALHLVSSPKVQESEAGSLLTKMIFYKHSVSKSLQNLQDGLCSPPGSPVKSTHPSPEKGAVHFNESLLKSLMYQLKCCKKNLLQGASATPMHGLIRAIRRCLTDQPTTLRQIMVADSLTNWSSLMERLLDTIQDITSFILLILSGQDQTGPGYKALDASTDGSIMAPSFGQMGQAIERLITDLAAYRIAEDEKGADGMMMVLSEEHQLILACCWLNLKECSILLGAIADTMPLCGEVDHGILTNDQLTSMANILVDILTRCRHKGAIDGCNQGFAKLCSRLLSSPCPELQTIPKTLLDQVLGLVTNEGAGSSFTKKSAGLPLLVESIVAAEPRTRERPLVAYAMRNLMEIASQPLPPNPNDRLDLPQSHALNIMMVLFRCSAVGTDMLRHCSQAAKLSISGFASPCWMIRNCSMRLYGTLIARMFGQKKVHDEHSQINSMSAATFFSRYPELHTFLLQEVGKFSQRQREDGDGARRNPGDEQEGVDDVGSRGCVVMGTVQSDQSRESSVGDGGSDMEGQCTEGNGSDEGKLFLHPSLHPVLTLLSKLGPGIGSEDIQSLSVFMEPVKQLAGSAIYAVRELAACALVPLIPQAQMSQQIVMLIDGLPSQAGSVQDFNRLHGDLLQMQKILEAAIQDNSIAQDDVAVIQTKLADRTWIGGATNPCALIRALFINVALDVTAEWHSHCADSSGAMQLASALIAVVQENFESSPPFQIGIASLNVVMSTAHLRLVALTSKALTSDILTSAQFLLSSPDYDVKLATLDYLCANIWSILSSGDSVGVQGFQDKLTSLVMDPGLETRCLEKALTLWTDLGEWEEADPGHCLSCDWLQLWDTLMGLVESRRGSGLLAAALPAIGQMLVWKIKTGKDRTFVDKWCCWMLKFSDPSQSETIRLATVRSMGIATSIVWSYIVSEGTEDDVEICVSLLKVLLSLLQDEVLEIRQQAAAIVSLRLPRGSTCPQYRHLHSNAAQQVVLDCVLTTFSWSARLMTSALAMLHGPTDLSQTIQQYEDISRGTLLFEQESANVYAEGVIEAKNLYQALVNTLERQQASRPDGFTAWMAGWYKGPSQLQAAQEDLDITRDLLATCTPLGGTLYGVTSHCQSYQAVYRQLLFTKFLCLVAEKIKMDDHAVKVMEKLSSNVQQIQQMPAVHPCLKMELVSLFQDLSNPR